MRDPATDVGQIVVRPATIERFDDIEPVINRACWCQWWRMSSGEYAHTSVDKRREALRAQVSNGPATGVVAYLGDLPIGWCGFGARASMSE